MELLPLKLGLLKNYRLVVTVILLKTFNSKPEFLKYFHVKRKKDMILRLF